MEVTQEGKIKVWIKDPGKPAYQKTIENTLMGLQKAVHGYIEAVTINEDIVILCDEEGRIWMSPYNVTVAGVPFVGSIVVLGVNGDGFDDCPYDEAKMRQEYPELFDLEIEVNEDE